MFSSTIEMKFRFIIKRQILSFKRVNKLALKNPSWLNLEHWKRSSPRIIFGFGPITFVFDSILERSRKTYILSPCFSIYSSSVIGELVLIVVVAAKSSLPCAFCFIALCPFKKTSANKCSYLKLSLPPLLIWVLSSLLPPFFAISILSHCPS